MFSIYLFLRFLFFLHFFFFFFSGSVPFMFTNKCWSWIYIFVHTSVDWVRFCFGFVLFSHFSVDIACEYLSKGNTISSCVCSSNRIETKNKNCFVNRNVTKLHFALKADPMTESKWNKRNYFQSNEFSWSLQEMTKAISVSWNWMRSIHFVLSDTMNL